jgi:phage gpG-like protein
MHISFAVTGLSDFKSEIDIIAKTSGDMTPVWRAVGVYLLDQARKRIMMGGDPPWAPTQYPSNLHPMLRKTGTLFNALNPGNMTVLSNGIQLGQGLPPYAKFLQGGTAGGASKKGSLRSYSTMKKLRSSGKTGIPPRKFLYVSPADRIFIQTMIKHYLVTGEILEAA